MKSANCSQESGVTDPENNSHKEDPRSTQKPSRATFLAQWTIVLAGLVSTIWFLIRVIPKPSRASYPCMRAAAPLMSGFVLYILSITGTIFALKAARRKLKESKPVAALILITLVVAGSFLALTGDEQPVFADSRLLLGPNQPVGIPKGIFP